MLDQQSKVMNIKATQKAANKIQQQLQVSASQNLAVFKLSPL